MGVDRITGITHEFKNPHQHAGQDSRCGDDTQHGEERGARVALFALLPPGGLQKA